MDTGTYLQLHSTLSTCADTSYTWAQETGKGSGDSLRGITILENNSGKDFSLVYAIVNYQQLGQTDLSHLAPSDLCEVQFSIVF